MSTGAEVRQGRLVDLVDLFGARRLAVGLGAVLPARLAAGSLGLGLGRPLGEGRGLALVLAAGLVEFGPEALVLGLEAVVFGTEHLHRGAEFLQLLQDREGHRHRVYYLDLRHNRLAAALLRPLRPRPWSGSHEGANQTRPRQPRCDDP